MEDILNKILRKNGPDKKDYSSIDEICFRNPEVLEQISKENLDFLKSKDSIMGHILLKPHGYAGDYEIIDRIYTKNKSEKFSKWDDYSLSNSAAVAVRNRKDYFKALIKEQIKNKPELSVLNIASGPARDVFEIFEETIEDKPQIKFTCLDLDKNAISYAKGINSKYLNEIHFINKNILRFDTEEKYDLVWSAGLFDYFNDKVCLS